MIDHTEDWLAAIEAAKETARVNGFILGLFIGGILGVLVSAWVGVP